VHGMIQRKGRGYNKHTIFTCLGIAVLSFIVFFLVTKVLDYYDLFFNLIAYSWTLSWWEGLTFSIVNLVDSYMSKFAILRLPRKNRVLITAAEEFVRVDWIAVLVTLIMVVAGFISLTTYIREYIAIGLTLAGMIYSFSQAWNTADRLRLRRLIREDIEYAKSIRKEI